MESLFGHLMLISEGCSKLNVRQLNDVLQRVCLSNALRLLPYKVRGFEFLGKLKMFMKSYSPDDYEAKSSENSYPELSVSNGTVLLRDSLFDNTSFKKKKKLKELSGCRSESDFDGNVRKFHKKF